MVKGAGHVEGGHLGEFELIARYFAPLANDAAALALRDDAAVLRPPESREIVISCDTIVAGVHFLPDDPPETIAHKALAVNLSDLAAKGAKPYVYLLALALPGEPDAGLARGLRLRLAQASRASRHLPGRRRHHADSGTSHHHHHGARAGAARPCRA